ncbi:MAG TPA: TrmH family RNA methyltransferase [Saprospiraceae bacterium]|nr:TrmH family RNA methyltransferase [Saprospiraceae bacterium]
MKKLFLTELNRLSIPEYKLKNKFPIILVADNIRSGHNIGSLFRIADSFSFQQIVLAGYTSQPPHPEIEKTALGSTQSVQWTHFEQAVDFILKLKAEQYQIIAIEQTDASLMLQEFKVNKDGRYVIVFGNEVKGVSQELLDIADHCLEIPQMGTKHSLNVSVAAGIVSWEFVKGFL